MTTENMSTGYVKGHSGTSIEKLETDESCLSVSIGTPKPALLESRQSLQRAGISDVTLTRDIQFHSVQWLFTFPMS